MKKVVAFFSIIFFLVFGQSLFAQGFSSAQIDSLVQTSMDRLPHAGVAVVVVKDGEIVHAKGYGYSSLVTNKKVDENTSFAIASNSKAFTSAALAILVDEGALDWNDKVVDHIPEFKMYDPYITANFTIIDLLTHRSGLGLGAGDLMIFPDGGDYTIDDVLKSFQYQKKVSDFRTKFDYDNLLYIVAGEIIERKTGLSWSEFVEKRIMQPLEMKNSAGVYQNLRDKTNVAMPHAIIDGKLTQIDTYESDLVAAAGGIYASASDLSKWMLMHLNNGKYGKTTLISEENHTKMWQPYTNMKFIPEPVLPYKNHFNAYGLGWGIEDKAGYIVFSHTGGLPGMLSKMTIIPELDLGVVVLTNADPAGYSFQTVSLSIVDSYLGIEGQDWVTRAYNRIEQVTSDADSVVTAVWNTVENSKFDHLNIDDYIGVYKDDWFGKMEVSEKNGDLFLRSVRSPKLTGQMFYYKSNTFAIKWDYRDMNCDAFISFVLDAEGKAIACSMEGISPNIDFSFDFQDLDLKRID